MHVEKRPDRISGRAAPAIRNLAPGYAIDREEVGIMTAGIGETLSRDDLLPLLRDARTIAVVGASSDPWRPSYGVTAYLKRVGYRVVPVNPTLLGTSLHGEPFRASLQDVQEQVDLVNVFRRPEFVPAVVEDAIAIRAPAIWLQLGIRHAVAAARAKDAGMIVVMDRCISVEHRRLLG